ncbi:MAG: HAMP domain-containing protein [Bryobacterales bacterium]|nr:HAMP domain-containing protein [Bryobacterales bacterium]
MRSLYGALLTWFGVLLAVSIGIIVIFGPMATLRVSSRAGPLERTNFLFLHQARQALTERGTPGLEAYLKSLSADLPARYFLLDSSYRDLVTGEDRAQLAEVGRSKWFVRRVEAGLVRTYSEGSIHLVSVIQPRAGDGGAGGLPYILLVGAVAATLCWLFAARLARPVRELARTMEAFGKGHTSVRSSIRRADEIGELAASFNTMADRMEALVAAERRLLQDVSHELQSPLARLAVAAKLTPHAADRQAAAARLQKEIHRISELIASLLVLTRAEGDPAQQRNDHVNLRTLVAEVVEDCELEAAEKDCRIAMVLADCSTRGNCELLHRAVENVLRNAVRYSPAGGVVDVRLSSDAERVEIGVRDRGPGVPGDSLERIFAPFYRVEHSRDESTGGTGLGLSLVKRAVLLHRGSVHATNSNPGLQISIHLPADNSQVHLPAPSSCPAIR